MRFEQTPIPAGVAGQRSEHFLGGNGLGGSRGNEESPQRELRGGPHSDLDLPPGFVLRQTDEQLRQVRIGLPGQTTAELGIGQRVESAADALTEVDAVENVVRGKHRGLPGKV